MDRVHRALLRPTSTQGGLRPPAGCGGLAAVLKRALVLALVIWSALPSFAAADTLSIDAYRSRLVQVRALLDRSRTVSAGDRAQLLAQARALIGETTALETRGERIAVDDRAIMEMILAPDGERRAIAILDAYIAVADRVVASRIDPAVADARLREILGSREIDNGAAAWFAAIGAWIASQVGALLSGLGPVPDLRFVPLAIAGLGLALTLFIVATLGRGLRERIRREVLVTDRVSTHADDPTAHLRSAEAALANGRAREAIHELYLYVLRSLAARELLRYDPALTDRELLQRAAAIPNVEALRDLIALNERAWFGLREPDSAEADRARSLAGRLGSG